MAKKVLLALLAIFVLFLISVGALYILDGFGLIDVVGKGKVLGISFKAVGASGFLIVFMTLLVMLFVYIFGKLSDTVAIAIKTFAGKF
jgi:hypothetical protein